MFENNIVFRDNVHQPFFSLSKRMAVVGGVGFILSAMATTSDFREGILGSYEIALWFNTFPWMVLFFATTLVCAGVVTYAYMEIGRYKQQEVFLERKRRILEVLLPESSEGSIALMEKMLELIADTSPSEKGGKASWEKGELRPVYSFEIVSRGGIVSFILFIPEDAYEITMSAVYSFFPGATIVDTDDYSMEVDYNPDTYEMHAVEWGFAKENALPIRTYLEFETIKGDPDPLVLLYDLFGGLRGEEKMWMQYIFRTENHPRPQDKFANNPLTRQYWKKKKMPENLQHAINDLQQKRLKIKEEEKKGSEGAKIAEPKTITASEKRLQDMGPRILEKPFFEVGIRMIYMAPKDQFKQERKKQMASVFQLTKTANNQLVAFEMTSDKTDPKKKQLTEAAQLSRQRMLQLYRDRLFLLAPAYTPYVYPKNPIIDKKAKNLKTPNIIISSETLATICHFPTKNIHTSTIRRKLAQTIEPPENLPI